MQDQDEQQRIREFYETEPGKAVLVEQLMGERENARRLHDDSAVLRTEGQLAMLGYQTPEQRSDAEGEAEKQQRRKDREQARVVKNRGEAAAHDDHAGGPVEQKAGVTDEDGAPAKAAAKAKPPQGRTAKPQQEG